MKPALCALAGLAGLVAFAWLAVEYEAWKLERHGKREQSSDPVESAQIDWDAELEALLRTQA